MIKKYVLGKYHYLTLYMFEKAGFKNERTETAK